MSSSASPAVAAATTLPPPNTAAEALPLIEVAALPPAEAADAHRCAYDAECSSLLKKNSTLMTREKRTLIIGLLIEHREGASINQLKKRFSTVDHFIKKCAVLQLNGQEAKLVEKPEAQEDGSMPSIESMRVYACVEESFDIIKREHAADHAKGRTLYERLSRNYVNIPRQICKVFTETCPRCLETMAAKKPTAGHQPIITRGFGKRGQIDLIDFQSMPDGNFKYLCNYIDHGIKFAFSIPIVSKRPSTVAFVLLQIFTIIGPPSILQSDNGREFIDQAGGKHIDLSDEVSLIHFRSSQ